MTFTERPVGAVRKIVDEDGPEREEFLKMLRGTVELWQTTANLRAGERGATVLQEAEAEQFRTQRTKGSRAVYDRGFSYWAIWRACRDREPYLQGGAEMGCGMRRSYRDFGGNPAQDGMHRAWPNLPLAPLPPRARTMRPDMLAPGDNCQVR